jgi:hypothetical protein
MALPQAAGVKTSNLVIFLALETSPVTYAMIANLGDYTGPAQQATVVDVSKHGDSFRRYVTTLRDSGTIGAPCWFDPTIRTLAGNADALAELFQSQDLRAWLMAFVDPDTIDPTSGDPTITEAVMSFNAYVSKFSLDAPVAGVWKATTEFRTDGKVEYLWADTTPPVGQPLP